jgi:hypothetical protein
MVTPTRSLILPSLLVLALAAGCSQAPTPAAPTASQPPAAPSAVSGATNTPSSQASAPVAVKPEAPIVPEQNPPGDIPDTAVFVAYRPPGAGLEFKVPEGWSRTNGATIVTFTDKLNFVTVTWQAVASAPTLADVQSTDVKTLTATQPAFKLVSVKEVKLAGGSAILLTYRQNGEPNAVTGKRYRLDVERFVFFRGGKRADLILSSPVGADNVDPWRTVSESFKWL